MNRNCATLAPLYIYFSVDAIVCDGAVKLSLVWLSQRFLMEISSDNRKLAVKQNSSIIVTRYNMLCCNLEQL